MEDDTIREIRATDYHDIYLSNQDFNPNTKSFSKDKVKEKIEIIATKTKDIGFVYEDNNEVTGYIHGSPDCEGKRLCVRCAGIDPVWFEVVSSSTHTKKVQQA